MNDCERRPTKSDPLSASDDSRTNWKLYLLEATVYLILLLGILATRNGPAYPVS